MICGCEKVGRPKSLPDVIIVDSSDRRTLEAQECVDYVIEDGEDTPEDLVIDTTPHRASWHLPELSQQPNKWQSTRDGSGVAIYIMDSGINPGHPEFTNAETIFTYDGLEFGGSIRAPEHGMLASTLAVGKTVGVAPGAKLYHMRHGWLTSEGVKAIDTMLDHYSKHDMPAVFSTSLSSSNPRTYHLVVGRVIEAGIIWVSAASNNSEPEARAPANHSDVIAVGATTQDGAVASYSNYGSDVIIYGFGHHVRVGTLAGGYRDNGSGTSSACPIVAGVLAQMIQGSKKLRGRDDVLAVHDWLVRTSRTGVRFNRDQIQAGSHNRLPSLTFCDWAWNQVPEPKPKKRKSFLRRLIDFLIFWK